MDTLFINVDLLAERVVRFLLLWSWHATLVLCAMMPVTRIIRSERAIIRYQIWLVGLAMVLLLPVFTAIAPLIPLTPAKAITPIYTVAYPEFLLFSNLANEPAASFSPWFIVFILWLCGLTLYLTRFCTAQRRIIRLRNQAQQVTIAEIGHPQLQIFQAGMPQILLSTEIKTPSLVGLSSPAVLLPSNIFLWTNNEERAAILRHELIHYEKRDHIILCLQSILVSFFYFHPVVRFAAKRLSEEREFVCDEAVLDAGVHPAIYAESILKAAEQSSNCGTEQVAIFSEKENLRRRIEMIITPQRSKKSALRYLVMALQLSVFVFLLWKSHPGRAAQPAVLNGMVFDRPIPNNQIEPLSIEIVGRSEHPNESISIFGGGVVSVVKIVVENKSGKVVQGYALNYGVADEKTSVTSRSIPVPELQNLKAGESQVCTIVWPHQKDPIVKVAFVNFSDGTTWGPDRFYSRDLVR